MLVVGNARKNDPGEKVCSEELVTSRFVLAGDEDVVDNPEQIAAEVYNQKLRDKGKPVIQGAGDVVPRQIESQKLRSTVHCEIDRHGKDQRKIIKNYISRLAHNQEQGI